MKFWMIVNVWGLEPFPVSDTRYILHPTRHPGELIFDKEEAERELLETKRENPTEEFILMESVGICKVFHKNKGLITIADMDHYNLRED
jgi:hypothetical protein